MEKLVQPSASPSYLITESFPGRRHLERMENTGFSYGPAQNPDISFPLIRWQALKIRDRLIFQGR